MSRLSNIIEEFIKKMLKEAEDGTIEIQRNELSNYFECAPSQINYVLMTRFTSDKGYYIESRRGGGGYIKIVKVNINKNRYIHDIITNLIGDSITKAKAYSLIDSFAEDKFVTERERDLMKIVLSDRVVNNSAENGNQLRATMLKDMLLILIEK